MIINQLHKSTAIFYTHYLKVISAGSTFIFVFLFLNQPSWCQLNGNSFEDSTLRLHYAIYKKAINNDLHIYNGKEYIGSYPLTTGTAFFESSSYQNSSIQYDGVLYHNILLAFDLVSNEVVIKGLQDVSLVLDINKVDFFLLDRHRFVKLKPDSSSKNSLPLDYYEVLHDGSMKLYVKRRKQVERSFRAEDPMIFAGYNLYFIKKGNLYHPIDSKKDLMALLKDQDRALKELIKKQRLNFKKNFEESVFKVVLFYDSLKK